MPLTRLFTFIRPSAAATVGERARRRVNLHLIPFLFFLYVLAYLDRVNVSAAQFGMVKPPAEGGLGFDKGIIGFGGGLFFIGYLILEIPSSISVVRKGARRVLTRVLILWGICATLAGFIGTPVVGNLFSWLPQIPTNAAVIAELDSAGQWLGSWFTWAWRGAANIQPGTVAAAFYNGLPDIPEYQFYFLRFMLGVFEGGFFPSVIVFLAHWYRPADRARAFAAFTLAIPLSVIIGNSANSLLLSLDWLGLPGWRWILIIEGILPVLAGVVTFFMLPDRPEQARWLRPDERDWLTAELASEAAVKHSHTEWFGHLWLVLLMTAVYLGKNIGSYGLTMFMPAILQSQSGLSDRGATLLSAAPYVLALVGMLVNGWHSDKTGERFGHTAAAMAMFGLGILAAALTDGLGWLPVVIMVLWVGPAMYAHMPSFWPIPRSVLGPTTAASAIGFINMIGNLGGFVGPMLVGTNATTRDGLLALAPWPIVAAVIVLGLGWYRRKK